MKQVVVIHGGDTFDTYEEYLDDLRNFKIDIERYRTRIDDWKPGLRQALGDNYEVILPIMPNKFNAQFDEWKLMFEKFIPFLNEGVILVAHSLGGIFLAKYLSENKFPIAIAGVFLVSAVYDEDSGRHSLASFELPEILNLQTENVMLYHSEDDPIVPFSALEKYKRALPNARTKIFQDRKHINQEEFPELVQDIKNL